MENKTGGRWKKRSVYTVTTFFTEESEQPTEKEYTDTYSQAQQRRAWILNNLDNVEAVYISNDPEEMEFLQ